jgi:hypothetical protein
MDVGFCGPVDGGGCRFKTVWSGRHLTVVDTGNYSEALAKGLNTG